MKPTLAIYLHDHLAGAAFAIDLLESLEKEFAQEPLGLFATGLRQEIDTDRQLLQSLADKTEACPHTLKDTLMQLGEKLSRWKLHRNANGGLGTFEALEALSLGILGKRALWTALKKLDDVRFRATDFDLLLERSEEQYRQVEARRIELVEPVLSGVWEDLQAVAKS